AEDGIRDLHVTGVQTCALPISLSLPTEDSPSWPRAHAWKACWGQPLASSNLASSAEIERVAASGGHPLGVSGSVSRGFHDGAFPPLRRRRLEPSASPGCRFEPRDFPGAVSSRRFPGRRRPRASERTATAGRLPGTDGGP